MVDFNSTWQFGLEYFYLRLHNNATITITHTHTQSHTVAHAHKQTSFTSIFSFHIDLFAVRRDFLDGLHRFVYIYSFMSLLLYHRVETLSILPWTKNRNITQTVKPIGWMLVAVRTILLTHNEAWAFVDISPVWPIFRISHSMFLCETANITCYFELCTEHSDTNEHSPHSLSLTHTARVAFSHKESERFMLPQRTIMKSR